MNHSLGRQTHNLLSAHSAPDYVKEAMYQSPVTPLESENAVGQFPCGTKADTWLSACKFFAKHASFKDPVVAQTRDRIMRNARLFGIESDIDAVQESAKLANDTSCHNLPDEAFAYVTTNSNGCKVRRLPLRNGPEIKTAVAWLDRYKTELPYSARLKIAEAILDRADQLSVTSLEVTEGIEKIAGRGTCSHVDAVRLLDERAELCNSRGYAELSKELVKLSHIVGQHPELCLEPNWRKRICEIVDHADLTIQVKKAYATGLQLPEEVLFGVTKQALSAAKEQLLTLTNGSVYTKQALRKLTMGDIRSALGDDIADMVSDDGVLVDHVKLATQLSTLPRPDAAIIDRLLQQRGESAVMKQASATDDNTARKQLADMYLIKMQSVR